MNHTYIPRTFNLPALTGISPKQVEIHIKLYEGYVKFTNTLREQLTLLRTDSEKNAYAISEVLRRFGFEFNGMRMHEYYFEQFEGGATPFNIQGELAKTLSAKYGDWDGFVTHFKTIGLTRGIGWTVLAYDPVGKTPHIYWVADHELGQLAGLPILFALDMWEHAFMIDYVPAEKAKYIDAFLANINWSILDTRFEALQK